MKPIRHILASLALAFVAALSFAPSAHRFRPLPK